MKISVNKQSKGKPQHAYIKPILSLTGHTNVDDYIAANHCKNMVDYIESVKKFKASHPELICLTPTGELAGEGSYETDGEVVWQFYEPVKREGINAKGWLNCTDNNPKLAIRIGFQTRQVYFVTTPANEQPKEESPYYYAPNTQDDIDASDGYKMDFDKNFGHGIPEHRRNGFLDGCRWKAHELKHSTPAPSLAPVDEKKHTVIFNDDEEPIALINGVEYSEKQAVELALKIMNHYYTDYAD